MTKFEKKLDKILSEMLGTHIKAPTRAFRRAGLTLRIGKRFDGPPETRYKKMMTTNFKNQMTFYI